MRRREERRAHGGPEKVKRQYDGGKLTVRERVTSCGPGLLHETGPRGRRTVRRERRMAEFTPANLISAGGASRPPVAVTARFHRARRANDGGIKSKLLAVERMACDLRLPCALVMARAVRLSEEPGTAGSLANDEGFSGNGDETVGE